MAVFAFTIKQFRAHVDAKFDHQTAAINMRFEDQTAAIDIRIDGIDSAVVDLRTDLRALTNRVDALADAGIRPVALTCAVTAPKYRCIWCWTCLRRRRRASRCFACMCGARSAGRDHGTQRRGRRPA